MQEQVVEFHAVPFTDEEAGNRSKHYHSSNPNTRRIAQAAVVVGVLALVGVAVIGYKAAGPLAKADTQATIQAAAAPFLECNGKDALKTPVDANGKWMFFQAQWVSNRKTDKCNDVPLQTCLDRCSNSQTGKGHGGNCIGVGTPHTHDEYFLFFSLDGRDTSRLESKGDWSFCLYEEEYKRKCSGETTCTVKYEDKKANCNSLEGDDASSCLEEVNEWWKDRCDVDDDGSCQGDWQCAGNRVCEQGKWCKGDDGCDK